MTSGSKPIGAWEQVAADCFDLSLDQMRREAWEKEGWSFQSKRFETKPVPGKPRATVRDLIAKYGKPTAVEPGLLDRQRVRRYFWGPIYVVATREQAKPLAHGLDMLLEQLLLNGDKPFKQGQATCEKVATAQSEMAGRLSIVGKPAGAMVTVTGPTGRVQHGKLPWNSASLPSGSYTVHVTAPGFRDGDKEILVESGFASMLEIELWER